MKLFVTAILFASVSLALNGQGIPNCDWRNEKCRAQYPAHIFSIGYAEGEVPPGKLRQDITEEVVQRARGNLVNSISGQTTGISKSGMSATTENRRYSESEYFTQEFTTESKAKTVGMETKSYYDTKTKTVYAFAYVKNEQLIEYYKKEIPSRISRVITSIKGLENRSNMSEDKAIDEYKKILERIKDIRNDQRVLNAVAAKSNKKVDDYLLAYEVSKWQGRANDELDWWEKSKSTKQQSENIRQLKNSIKSEVARVEKAMAEAKSEDSKAKAIKKYEEILSKLKYIEDTQSRLRKADKNASDEDLQWAKVADLHSEAISRKKALERIPTDFLVSYRASLTAPYGASFGVCERWGGYAQYSWNMALVREKDLVEAYYAGGGERRYYRRSFTAGVMFRPARYSNWFLYAGGGYGKYGAAYKASTDSYYYCPTLTKGVELEGGVAFAFSIFENFGINASVGYSTIAGSQLRELHFGFGFKF